MFKSKKLAVLAALLSLLMILSLTAVTAFAEETDTTADTQAVVETGTGEADTNADTEPVTGEVATGEVDTVVETGTEAGTSAGTEAGTKEETTTGSTTPTPKDNTGLIRALVNLGVGVVILVVLGILAYKFRAKIPGWWKGLKSECGKITWCPKDKLKKNTLVVVVIILAIAVAIGVLDFVFSRGMILLGDLIHS